MAAHFERTVAATDERTAFARLADRELDRAYRLAAVILGDSAEAQDATHDAVVAAWRRSGSLHDPDRFEPWFTRILVNTCRDRMRRRRRQPAVEIDLARDIGAARDAYADVDDRLALDGAFDSLSPDHRVVVVLRFYADLSIDEIAERVGAPAGTVKSRLHHATRRLHAALVGEGDLDD
jgi:RNA polymerase sigma-70 factor (ECF subfamily)